MGPSPYRDFSQRQKVSPFFVPASMAELSQLRKSNRDLLQCGQHYNITIPLITAHLSQRSIADIMWFDTAIAAIGFILALFIGLRSRKETRHHTLKENIAPGG